MKPDSTEVRYPGVQVKVQEFLRQRGDGRVTTSIVQAAVGHNRTTVASAMATLARTPDTGLSDVSAGLYNYTSALDAEWVRRRRRDGIDVPQPGTTVTDPALKVTHPARPTPASLPGRRTTTPVKEEPVVVVTAARAQAMEDNGTTRAGTPRQRRPMQRDVGLRALRWLSSPENKGDIFSATEVAQGIGALQSSVSTVLRHMADGPDWPVRRIMPGTLYTVPLTAAEQAERERVDAGDALDVRKPETVPEAVTPEPAVAAPEPPPAPVAAPEPAPEPAVAADDSMVLLEKLAETVPGKWLTQDADGHIYWLERLR